MTTSSPRRAPATSNSRSTPSLTSRFCSWRDQPRVLEVGLGDPSLDASADDPEPLPLAPDDEPRARGPEHHVVLLRLRRGLGFGCKRGQPFAQYRSTPRPSRRRHRSPLPRAPLADRRRARGRAWSPPRSTNAGRVPGRTPRARLGASRGRRPGRPRTRSTTSTSARDRLTCRRNRWPSPRPSLAPSMRPGTSATTNRRSSLSATPRLGESVVKG